MSKSLRNLLSSILGFIFYLIFKEEDNDRKLPFKIPQCIKLDQNNYKYLMKDEWTVINGENDGFSPSAIGIQSYKLAVLFVNTIQEAELAARFKITGPKDKVIVKNGEFVKNNIKYKIDRPIPFHEIVDIYVYNWALKIRKTAFSVSKIDFILEHSMYSFSELVGDILSFCFQN